MKNIIALKDKVITSLLAITLLSIIGWGQVYYKNVKKAYISMENNLEKILVKVNMEQKKQKLPTRKKGINTDDFTKDRELLLYENIFKPSIFFREQRKTENIVLKNSVEEKTTVVVRKEEPVFIYRGTGNIGGMLNVAIEEVNSGKIYFVTGNETIGKYKVVEVNSEKVIFEDTKGKRTEILRKIKR